MYSSPKSRIFATKSLIFIITHLKAIMAFYHFTPVFKTPLWGGHDIARIKGLDSKQCIGESWEISGVPGDESPVSQGAEAGATLPQLIEKHGAAFLGKRNYERYGANFPLLIKFISAATPLSIQVHPDDKMAQSVEGKPYGKTEMWYVVEAHPGANLYSGFSQALTPETYDQLLQSGRLTEALARYETRPGDCFVLPAGQVHSIGEGNFIIEIQQSSDLTYRVYDFDRVEANGQKRELHTKQARQAIDFDHLRPDYRTAYQPQPNQRVLLESREEFTTALYQLTEPLRADYSTVDSFAIFVAYEGEATLRDNEGNTTTLCAGQSVLMPASTQWVEIMPTSPQFSCIETYV